MTSLSSLQNVCRFLQCTGSGKCWTAASMAAPSLGGAQWKSSVIGSAAARRKWCQVGPPGKVGFAEF